jgi:hypothetical protein
MAQDIPQKFASRRPSTVSRSFQLIGFLFRYPTAYGPSGLPRYQNFGQLQISKKAA